MNLIEGISDQPQQQVTIQLTQGSFLLSLSYSLQQGCWFYSISWNGNPVCNGLRLVTSPNILQQYINVIPFGILVLSNGNVEPTGIEDLSDGTVSMYLLQGGDLVLVAQTSFGAPAGAVQPVGSTAGGSQVIIPPTNWGPANGDLSGAYPGPNVVAVHEGGGQQLTIAPIADGLFLKRVGTQIVGTTPSGVGNVVGPVGATNLNLAAFNGVTGTLIEDSGISSASITAGIAAALATAEGYTNTVASSTLATAHTDAVAQAAAAQAASFPASGALGGAGDLTGNMPNPTVDHLSAVKRITKTPIGYPTGGTVQVRFDLGSYDHIGITTAGTTTFSPAGSSGLVNGATQTLDIGNTTGSPVVLAWPATWLLANGALPTSLAAGAWIRVMLFSSGTTEAGVIAAYFPSAGGGGGSLPVGGTPYQRLAKNSASTNDVGWYSGSVIDAADYLANGSTLQAALTAACAVNGCLLLPPGQLALPAGASSLGLQLSAGFTGGISIRGCGKNVTFLNQANAAAGVTLNCSSGQPGTTFVNLEGFSVVANNAGCTTGLTVDYGTGAVTNQGGAGSCTFSKLLVKEGTGSWMTQAYYFRNIWYSTWDNISGGGGFPNNASTGYGLVLDSCINPQLTNVSLEGYTRGVYVPSGSGHVGESQGVNFTNLRILACGYGIWFYGMDLWVTNFMIDNGNFFIPGCESIHFAGAGSGSGSCLSKGQILQYGGQYQVELNNCSKVTIDGVDFTYISNAPTWVSGSSYVSGLFNQNGTITFVQDPSNGSTYQCISSVSGSSTQPHADPTHWTLSPNNGFLAEIWLTNSTSLCNIFGNTFSSAEAAVLADTGTTGTKANNNIQATFVDHGTNSLVS